MSESQEKLKIEDLKVGDAVQYRAPGADSKWEDAEVIAVRPDHVDLNIVWIVGQATIDAGRLRRVPLKIEDLKVGDMVEYRSSNELANGIWLVYPVVRVGQDCIGPIVILHNDCGPCCHQRTIDQGRLRRHVVAPAQAPSVVAEIARLADGFEAKLKKQVSDLECELVRVRGELERTKKASEHDREMKEKYLKERDWEHEIAAKESTRADELKKDVDNQINGRMQFKRAVAGALGMVWLLGMHEPDEAAVIEKATKTRPPVFAWKTPTQYQREIDELSKEVETWKSNVMWEREHGAAAKQLADIRACLESWEKSSEIKSGKCSLLDGVRALMQAAKTLDHAFGDAQSRAMKYAFDLDVALNERNDLKAKLDKELASPFGTNWKDAYQTAHVELCAVRDRVIALETKLVIAEKERTNSKFGEAFWKGQAGAAELVIKEQGERLRKYQAEWDALTKAVEAINADARLARGES